MRVVSIASLQAILAVLQVMLSHSFHVNLAQKITVEISHTHVLCLYFQLESSNCCLNGNVNHLAGA